MASNDHLYSQDAIYLFEAAENEYPLLSSPLRFRNPLAPSVASELEKRPMDLKKVFWAYREIREIYNFIIVEGIGGLLVPFTNNYFVADLVKEFDLPVVIVARSGLGTINHTLLTVQAAKNRGLEIKGIILNGQPEANLSLAEKTNPRIVQDLIARFEAVPPDFSGRHDDEGRDHLGLQCEHRTIDETDTFKL